MTVSFAWRRTRFTTDSYCTHAVTRRVSESISHYRAELICGLLLVVMGLNFLSVLPRKNLTLDETIHIPAGFYNLHGNLGINIEHPPLVKMLRSEEHTSELQSR